MRRHLKVKHDWEEQPCLYSTDKPIDHGSQEYRKTLRAGPPLFPKESDQPKATEKTQQHLKSPKTKEGELLKLMKEGS
jgi:hypothetical protein